MPSKNLKTGTLSKGSDNKNYRWLGAQWGSVTKSGKIGRMATKKVAASLNRKYGLNRSSATKNKTQGLAGQKLDKSSKWFKDTIEKSLGKLKPVAKPVSGAMYTFSYDPKHKKTLPYYDKHPLIILLGPAKGGFLGLNVHYLSPANRDRFFNAMLKFTGKKSIDDITDKDLFKINWAKVKMVPMIEKTIHHYLYPHVKTSILEISPTEWENTIYLPTAAFKGKSQTQVWRA